MPSTGPVIACMLKDCANIKLQAISNVINRDEELTAPMRLKPAMVEIQRIHNSPNPIKPQDIEDMDVRQVLDHLKAEDENIVRDIIAVLHEVYNTDESLARKKGATATKDARYATKYLDTAGTLGISIPDFDSGRAP